MGFSFGPGFDSPQLHEQAAFKHPARGVLLSKHPVESLLSVRDAKMQNDNAPALGLNAICRTGARGR